MSDYNDVNLFIDGNWIAPEAGKMLVVINPATGEPAGKVAHAERAQRGDLRGHVVRTRGQRNVTRLGGTTCEARERRHAFVADL